MGKIEAISLSRKELDSGSIPFNYVMVESEMTAEGKKTKGGIIIGHSEDVTFHSSVESADIGWEADLAEVCSKVYKLPQKLYYNREDISVTMPWDCDMDLQIGDMVWFSVLESRNATAIRCEDYYYKLIPFRDIITAKRGNEVIMLNGFVLLDKVYTENKSALAISRQGDVDQTKGIVRYIGKPNKEYIMDNYVDFIDLEIGDEVLLSPKTPLINLERKSYLAKFDGDKLYWYVQRRRISMVLSKNN
jgi:hypothetical protein